MTAEKLLKEKSGDACEFSYYCEVIPVSYALEYARLKCKELLEIVAQKATIKYRMYEGVSFPYIVEETITKAVDLDSFIS